MSSLLYNETLYDQLKTQFSPISLIFKLQAERITTRLCNTLTCRAHCLVAKFLKLCFNSSHLLPHCVPILVSPSYHTSFQPSVSRFLANPKLSDLQISILSLFAPTTSSSSILSFRSDVSELILDLVLFHGKIYFAQLHRGRKTLRHHSRSSGGLSGAGELQSFSID